MIKIRVLQIVESMNMGGIQNFIMNIYRNINRDTIQFDFITHRAGIFDDEIKELGGKIYRLDYLTKVGHFKYKKNLREFFLCHPEYSTIHVHLNQVSGIVLQVAKQCKIKKRIVHSHSKGNLNNILIKAYKLYLQSMINKNSTLRLACSNDAGRWLYKKNNFKIVLNGIDFNRFKFNETNRNEIRQNLNIPSNSIVIGCVGSLIKSKNHMFLIDIFHNYLNYVNDARLVLVGDGNLKKGIVEKIRKIDIIEKVKFVDIATDIEKYYSAFDFFVFPTLYEGLGMVLIEAQISGLKSYTSEFKVPIEVNISNNLKYISLDEKPESWALKIERNKNYNRENININNYNYEISNVVKEIEKIYLD